MVSMHQKLRLNLILKSCYLIWYHACCQSYDDNYVSYSTAVEYSAFMLYQGVSLREHREPLIVLSQVIRTERLKIHQYNEMLGMVKYCDHGTLCASAEFGWGILTFFSRHYARCFGYMKFDVRRRICVWPYKCARFFLSDVWKSVRTSVHLLEFGSSDWRVVHKRRFSFVKMRFVLMCRVWCEIVATDV